MRMSVCAIAGASRMLFPDFQDGNIIEVDVACNKGDLRPESYRVLNTEAISIWPGSEQKESGKNAAG
jgi:hypothetical protein